MIQFWNQPPNVYNFIKDCYNEFLNTDKAFFNEIKNYIMNDYTEKYFDDSNGNNVNNKETELIMKADIVDIPEKQKKFIGYRMHIDSNIMLSFDNNEENKRILCDKSRREYGADLPHKRIPRDGFSLDDIQKTDLYHWLGYGMYFFVNRDEALFYGNYAIRSKINEQSIRHMIPLIEFKADIPMGVCLDFTQHSPLILHYILGKIIDNNKEKLIEIVKKDPIIKGLNNRKTIPYKTDCLLIRFIEYFFFKQSANLLKSDKEKYIWTVYSPCCEMDFSNLYPTIENRIYNSCIEEENIKSALGTYNYYLEFVCTPEFFLNGHKIIPKKGKYWDCTDKIEEGLHYEMEDGKEDWNKRKYRSNVNSKFFILFQDQLFSSTLERISSFQNKKVNEILLSKELVKDGYTQRDFDNIINKFVELNLIQYEKDNNFDRFVILTKKAKRLLKKIKKIEKLIFN